MEDERIVVLLRQIHKDNRELYCYQRDTVKSVHKFILTVVVGYWLIEVVGCSAEAFL